MSLPFPSRETEAQRGCATGGHVPFPSATPSPQGTPLKYDTSTSLHRLQSTTCAPSSQSGRTFRLCTPLDAMADTGRWSVCYEESLKSRTGAVSSSGGSITRGPRGHRA